MGENKNNHQKITMTHTKTTCIDCIALRAGKKGARFAEIRAPVCVKKISYIAQTTKITTMQASNTNSDIQR